MSIIQRMRHGRTVFEYNDSQLYMFKPKRPDRAVRRATVYFWRDLNRPEYDQERMNLTILLISPTDPTRRETWQLTFPGYVVFIWHEEIL